MPKWYPTGERPLIGRYITAADSQEMRGATQTRKVTDFSLFKRVEVMKRVREKILKCK